MICRQYISFNAISSLLLMPIFYSYSRGFGRCLVIRKYQTSLRKYSNGAVDICKGPPPMDDFNRKDPR